MRCDSPMETSFPTLVFKNVRPSVRTASVSCQSVHLPPFRGSEFVPDSMHGSKKHRTSEIRLQFLPQTQNVIVDRSGARIIVISPNLVQEIVSRNCPVWIRDKVLQHFELHGSQVHRTVGSADLHGL